MKWASLEASWDWCHIIVGVSINFLPPLYHITNKSIPFVWDDSCQLAFTTLKNAFMHAPILKYPDFLSISKQFQLYMDASDTGIGLCLNNMAMFLACMYHEGTVIRKELQHHTKGILKDFNSLKQFRHYPLGGKFFIITYHFLPAVVVYPEVRNFTG